VPLGGGGREELKLLKFNALRFENVRFWEKPSLYARVGKNPGFFKKTQPSGFFWVFLGFFGFFGFFWVFLGFLPRREGF
jgi:hypothetical protein